MGLRFSLAPSFPLQVTLACLRLRMLGLLYVRKWQPGAWMGLRKCARPVCSRSPWGIRGMITWPSRANRSTTIKHGRSLLMSGFHQLDLQVRQSTLHGLPASFGQTHED